MELKNLVLGKLLPHILESKLTQLRVTIYLTSVLINMLSLSTNCIENILYQMGDLIMNTFNKLKNQIGLGRSMKCEE